MTATLADLVAGLRDRGRVQVSPLPLAADPSDDAAIVDLDRLARLACAGTPPPLDLAIARAALRALHLACQLLAYPDLEPGPPPVIAGSDAAAHWSVDLAFRHLPALAALVRARAAADPLLPWIETLIRPWPLSAASIAMADVPDPAPLLAHPALAAEYCDRCIAAGDVHRLADPRLRRHLAVALGGHPALVPSAAAIVTGSHA